MARARSARVGDDPPLQHGHRLRPVRTAAGGRSGDVAINPYSRRTACSASRRLTTRSAHGCMPLTLGGDHTLTLPVLRAVARRHGPVGLIHVDAHSDTNEEMFGEQLAHGTTFRRAFEEGLLAPEKWCRLACAAAAMRRTTSTGHAAGLPRGAGRGLLAPIADAADDGDPRTDGRCAGLPQLRYRRTGSGLRTGTGTPEVGGLSVWQGLEIVRGCHGLNRWAATWWRCRHLTIAPATRRCWPPTCCLKCCACCRPAEAGALTLPAERLRRGP